MMDLTDKKITILGGQRSGMALARLASRLKGKAKISEQRSVDSLPREFRDWASQNHVDLEFNGHTPGFVEDSDILVLSPGVSIHSAPVQWARSRNIPVLGEIEFAAQFCSKPIIAVTGSNGKTTVVTLISEVLTRAGYKARLCGNVGYPFSEYVLDLADQDYVVLEVSSFQMESLLDPSSEFRKSSANGGLQFKGFKPYIAVILNFSQNHLDRHQDLQEYLEAKKRIFINQDDQDHAILNAGDPYLKDLPSQLKARVSHFDPRRISPDGGRVNPNFLVVTEVARILGVDRGICEEVFQRFKGVEHRLEWVRRLNGVDFINDSKATTAQAAIWALESLESPVLMICGGKDKNIDFSVVTDLARQKVKKMFVIGEAKKKLARTFDGVIAVEECDTLENAVRRARGNAGQGDCVLLSPMCASFDMFSDYEQRGRVFKEIVNKLV